jgi:hypothetical protein
MSNSRLLGVVIILQGLILAGQWLGGSVGIETPAQAQIADPARDRQQLLDEAKQTNAKLDKLIELLRSGEIQVKVAQPDQARGAARGR